MNKAVIENSNILLEVCNLEVQYDAIKALHGLSFTISKGEIVTLIGANGAGKSSILRAISGLTAFSGDIFFEGQNLQSFPAHKIVGLGIAHVPEGRGVFGNLTVNENLQLATWQRKDKAEINADYDRIFTLFPKLKIRLNQLAGTLSGGEQQMLVVGRAIMSRGRLLLLDEPSMGLAPKLVQEIFHIIKDINNTGTTILLVEQNANMALQIASRAYVLETGRIVLAGTGLELLGSPRIKSAYLGS
ncbi:MAG: ABC transporter ATP-binding protein [Methylococcales bacterium]|jgi:branched-chain amino acid transport system ATP-binding protein